ncbi:MAG: CPP1-like family protein [Cyanobacteria bacterium P01_G01_bin.38]
MSNQNAYETLGLDEASSFEEVQAARQRLVKECEDNPQRKEAVEAAYDSILMERLRMRQEGKIKVPDRIRYAEKQAEKLAAAKASATPSASNPPTWLQDWLDTPSRNDILWPSAIYLALAVLSWFTATASPAEASNSPAGTGASVMLGFGIALCVYFLHRKERKFWRSVLLSAGSLLIGIAIGFAFLALLKGQGVVFTESQVAAIAAIMAFIFMWFASSFLR